MATSIGLKQFARRMATVAKLFGADVEKTVRRAAIAADTTAVTLTPFDTGRARSNWIVTVGQVSDVVKGEPASPGVGTTESLAQGQAAVDSWKIGAGPIFISNGLPYIIPLDQGSSQQATAGMSNQAIEAARRQLQRARVLRS